MHKNWLHRIGLGSPSRTKPALPDGERVYAIGDVHGQAELLDLMLGRINADIALAGSGTRSRLVLLGDYIDRGLGSAKVIERLSTLSGMPIELTCLKGNHEAAMLDFLAEAKAGPVWVQYGGGETLASYGVKPPIAQADEKDWESARQALLAALPDYHLDFLKSLEPYVIIGPYLFVHAGIDPNKPLSEQGEAEFLWVRDAFLHSRKSLDHVVVHGHTPEPDYHHDNRRIGIDTGAYLTGVLTAVKLEGEDVSFLQVRRADL